MTLIQITEAAREARANAKRAKRWKKAAKYWRSRARCNGFTTSSTYSLPWWSNAYPGTYCLMCHAPHIHRDSNVCDTCWRQETGE